MNREGHTIPSITTISTLGLFIFLFFSPLANLKWYYPFPCFPSTELLLAQFIFREKTYFIFILSLFYFLTIPHSMQDRSSLTRDRAYTHCHKTPSLNHWTTREGPYLPNLKLLYQLGRKILV